MSRIGKMPVTIPAGVEFKCEDNLVTVKGPKGTLTQKIHPNITVKCDAGVVTFERSNDEKFNRSLHGLSRNLVANMVEGVSKGFSKSLEVNGVGYRVQMDGKNLVMNLGYSHQVVVEPVEGITIECPGPNQIVISGPDKQKVGQFAAEVREKRPPEPYKGKGIRYAGEVVRLKEGKSGKK